MKHDIIEYIDPNLLTPHPDNSMKHGDGQITSLVASFEQFGFNGVIVIDEDNIVLAGHGRRLAAIRANLPTVNCLRRTGLSDLQKRAYIIADNKIGREGEWDKEVLAQQIEQLSGDGFDLESLGISPAALASIADGGKKQRGSSADAEGGEAPVKRRRAVRAIEDVIAERERQINEEAWLPALDDRFIFEELAIAGSCYARPQSSGRSNDWPFPREWWKPAGRRRELVKAAALIIAEIERLDRAEAASVAKKPKKPKKAKA